MTINAEEVWRVLKHIRTFPETHRQHMWVSPCGTAGCFAGWTALLNGWGAHAIHGHVFNPATGQVAHASSVARRILGLSEREALFMFHATNTIDDLERLAEIFITRDQEQA